MNKDKERIVFDAIVSNPPYQITKNGNNTQIWQHFVKVANLCGAKWVSMIHPGRWVVPTSSVESIRDDFIKSGLQKFNVFSNAEDVFPNINLPSSITITNFKKDYKGKITYYSNDKETGTYDKDTKFFENAFEEEAFNKINLASFDKRFEIRKLGEEGNLYGYNKIGNKNDLIKEKSKLKNPISIFCNNVVSKGANTYSWYYIEKDKLQIPADLLKTRKVLISWFGEPAWGFRATAQIIEKNAIGAGYYFIPENDTDYELKLIQSFLNTKTVRFLMSITMKNNRVKGFENIPDYTYFMKDLVDPKYNNGLFVEKDGTQKGLFSDEYFYNRFNFSQELINHIENRIKSKELV